MSIPEVFLSYELPDDQDIELDTEEGPVVITTRGDNLFVETQAYSLQVKHFYFGPMRRYYLTADDEDAIGGINTRTVLSKALDRLEDAFQDKLYLEWCDIEGVVEWIKERLTQKPFV